MKISFVLSSLRLSGGVKAIIEIANGLIDRGHSVNLIVPKATIDPNISATLSQQAVIRESATSLSSKTNIFGKLQLTYSLAKAIPPSDIIISTHTPSTAVTLIASKFFNKGIPIWYFLDYPEMFSNRPVESLLLKYALKWHNGAIAISEFCKQTLESSNIQVPVKVIPVGISNAEIFSPKNPFDEEFSSPNTASIFFLGDPRPRKGLADFVKAAEIVYQQNPNIELWIASKMDLTISSPAPYKLFIRPTDQDLVNLYRNCAVFVSASWVEGFGLPPLEAMACGAPVVLTDSKGVRDFAKNYENCILTPPQNPRALADGILKIIRDPILAEKFRRNGPPTASQFTWKPIIDEFEKTLLAWSSH